MRSVRAKAVCLQ